METKTIFLKGEDLFNNGQFDDAFIIFKTISENETFTNEERAEAFNMIGVITSFFAPHLSPSEEQNPLFFFKKSLEFSPCYLDALLNIVNTFGQKSHSMHNDKYEFFKAYDILISKLYQNLNETDKEELQLKYQFYQSLEE